MTRAPQDFLTLGDVPAAEWPRLFDRATTLKAQRGKVRHGSLAGLTIALVFEKPSTRTRMSFQVAAFELGGQTVEMSATTSQLGRGEPIQDTARILSGYCHAIVVRTFGQDRIAEFARSATIPVINGLSDQHHPCQVATDLFTVREHFGALDGLRYAWIGDGNNMACSWIEAAGLLGLDLVLACPDGFAPDSTLVAAARDAQQRLGKGSLALTTDPVEAATGAHVLSTDVWASMGQEDDAARRRAAFAGFCIDAALVSRAAANAIVLHCLPAHRGEEISGDVLDGPRSLVWVQAENRLHVGKVLLEHVVIRSRV
ncbi:MAG: ornithine carbamoyltransferase [Deltaproteobacteria bacterium]|nr:MAG: ornithine carbamoyltransferase [Deltaproteobacteria bacterium]